MRNILSQSKNFKLFGAYEEAQLEGPGISEHVVVGDFYGGANCGCIDVDEKWCISAGNGLVIYSIIPPFQDYQYGQATQQWVELWRTEKDKNWYPEVIYQIEEDVVRLVIDVYSETKGVYDLNVKSLDLVKRV